MSLSAIAAKIVSRPDQLQLAPTFRQRLIAQQTSLIHFDRSLMRRSITAMLQPIANQLEVISDAGLLTSP